MKTKQKKLAMLVIGLLVFIGGNLIPAFYTPSSQLIRAGIILIRYCGLIAFIMGVSYFGRPHSNNSGAEETEAPAKIKAKAKVFDFMLYVLLGLVFMLIELFITNR